ncbi:MAG: hypothetical protein AVDCRST_MAG07-1056 [uncultured Frankineae bacterium]|uniref:Orc1-like AAA ATPase domain-containing protein n=1 Tax=uncultured Frankineae bacterium TaxID=437475 RepID=A0A6J4KE77_9ACTN|nr:MAG: hypothetical protein AVDCRST_MAG07-1056 [uncultured Frankineae bacterium]
MSEPPTTTESLLQALDARIGARQERAAGAPSRRTSVNPLLQAAAVLHVFDPTALRSVGTGGSASDAALVEVLHASVPAIGWRGAGLRTLRLQVRRTALRELGSRTAMRAALTANPDRVQTELQQQFERWLGDDGFALDRMAYVELEALRQLYDWGLASSDGALPPVELVERARARRSTVAVFEHLVDEDFVGRAEELALLEGHVRSPGGVPLVIWGPGGAGKTALVGRFLIRYAEDPEAGWFPFAYLPFDSETLDVREPFTLLLPAATQLGNQAGAAQGPSAPTEAARLRDALQRFTSAVGDYRDRRGALRRRASDVEQRVARLDSLSSADVALYDAFADVLETAAEITVPPWDTVLLVFDTFEEVVYRAAEDLLGFWSMLEHLQRRLPRLRVVIAGRGRPDPASTAAIPLRQVVLGDLDEDDAVRLLGKLGVDDPALARRVAHQVGGSPMSLRLAASVVTAEGAGDHGLQGLSVHKIGPELVRGHLYRRLLDHIHDEDVRALAHPGMVLRRVTPTIIERVLAPACDLPGVSSARAVELFEELQREQSLVSLDKDGSLHYREDVRRPVLQLLAHDAPASVRLLHAYAVEHYLHSAAPAHRAEELYHRMMLAQPPEQLDDRWLPGVERFLASAIEELPLEQRRWLAGRMSIELPAEVYRLAHLGEWERLVGRRALQLLRYGGPAAVLDLLSERPERTPGSPLSAVEARVLLDLQRPQDAASLLDGALAEFPALGNPGRLAELLWLRTQAAAVLGESSTRLALLHRLVDVTAGMHSSLAHVQALTELLGALDPDSRPDAVGEAGRVRPALAQALGRLTQDEIATERSLVRLALVRLGPHYPSLVAQLAPLVLFDLTYLADSGLVDLLPALPRVRELLADLLPSDGAPAGDGRATAGVVAERIVSALARRTRAEEGGAPLARLAAGVLLLLRAEGASLSGSSLAGLEDYRETWELETTREVAG